MLNEMTPAKVGLHEEKVLDKVKIDLGLSKECNKGFVQAQISKIMKNDRT